MYADISRNKRQSVFLIAVCSAVFIGLGWLLGAYAGDPSFGIILATMFATGMALFSYFAGDKVALASSGAREVDMRTAPEVYRLVENLAITAGLPMPKVYVINDPSPNAFATGRDPKHASVAVTTGLLGILDRTELEGVLAHELAHVGNYDIRFMTLAAVLVGGIMLLADVLLRSAFGGGDKRVPPALALIGLVLAILSPLIAQLLKLAVSRSREYLADASGALLTRYPEGLARALEKIAAHGQPMQKANHATAHLFISNPFGARADKKPGRFAQLFSTHPPAEDRVARLRKMGV